MADYAPPPGPPPPQVPEGWKAVWNDQYKEWFYVNLHTKASQWDKPTEPAYAAPSEGPPPGAPPGYDHGSAQSVGPEKSNNPFMQGNNTGGSYGGSSSMNEDERLARQLQEQEQARAQTGSRGANDSYYGAGGPQAPNYGNSAELPPREGKKGLLGKLSSKLGGSSSSKPHGYAGGGYGGGAYRQQYPPQGYGQPMPYGQPGYGQPMHGGYGQPMYGGHPGYGGYGHGPPRRGGGGGMGMAGGVALGAGAGLLGGALIADGMNDEYQDGYEDGMDDGGGGDDGGGE